MSSKSESESENEELKRSWSENLFTLLDILSQDHVVSKNNENEELKRFNSENLFILLDILRHNHVKKHWESKCKIEEIFCDLQIPAESGFARSH
jgi:hypothetical protein